MTDIEQLLKDSLRDKANSAPAPRDLAMAARARHRMRWLNTVLATVAVAALAAGSVAATLAFGHSPEPHSVLTKPLPSDPATQVIAFHGIEITVPSSWDINDVRCASPAHDTVIRDITGFELCYARTPPGVHSVWLEAQHDKARGQVRTSASGVRMVITNVSVSNSGTGVSVVIPARHVELRVDATGRLFNRITNSVTIASTSPEGCPMRSFQATPERFRGHESTQYMAPSAASTVALCHYSNRWLMASVTTTVNNGGRIRGSLNGAKPRAMGEPPATEYCTEHSLPSKDFVLALVPGASNTKPGMIDWPVWVDLGGGCGEVGITNGKIYAPLTRKVIDEINADLHIGLPYNPSHRVS